MTRLIGIAVVLFLLNGCNPNQESGKSNTAENPTPPNIIMLVGDDQGYPYFGFMGADYLHTPNMDSLAASGLVFTDGYVSDNHCRPSLQTLLTGILPIDYQKQSFAQAHQEIQENKVPTDSIQAYLEDYDRRARGFSHFNTLPKLLASKGYASFQGGKWWEYSYQNGGFTHGMTKGWNEDDLKQPGWFIKHMGGQGMDLARVTNQPVYDFLEETKDKPFFLWYAPSLPHYPFDAPEKYYNLYKDQDMSESAKQYYANCTWFDDAWGQLVDYLKANALYDNTLIVYVNDNGWEQEPDQEFTQDPLRSHNGGDKGKGSIYDMSFRSPFIFSWPGQIKAGRRTSALMHSADIPATILDYVGIPIPEDFYGVSYKSVIDGEKEGIRNLVQGNVISTRGYSEETLMGLHVEGYWVRKGPWFLRWHVTDNELELFDLRNDLRNEHNVAEKHPEVLQELHEIAKTYKSEKGEDPRIAYYRNMTGF